VERTNKEELLMPIVLAVVAALGGLAFWRRNKIEEDASKISNAAREKYTKMRSGRKDLLVELGERVYAKSTGEGDETNESEIDRLIGELEQIDAASESEESEPAVEANASI
jgi:hypothetical protein